MRSRTQRLAVQQKFLLAESLSEDFSNLTFKDQAERLLAHRNPQNDIQLLMLIHLVGDLPAMPTVNFEPLLHASERTTSEDNVIETMADTLCQLKRIINNHNFSPFEENRIVHDFYETVKSRIKGILKETFLQPYIDAGLIREESFRVRVSASSWSTHFKVVSATDNGNDPEVRLIRQLRVLLERLATGFDEPVGTPF